MGNPDRNPIRDTIMWHPYPEEKPPDQVRFCIIVWDGELHPAMWLQACQRYIDIYDEYMFEDDKVSWWTQVLMPSNIDMRSKTDVGDVILFDRETMAMSMQAFAMAFNVEP